MSIAFPNNPSTGDTHQASNGITYEYDGEKWITTGTNSAGIWTRTGTTIGLSNAGDDVNINGTFQSTSLTDGSTTKTMTQVLASGGDITIQDEGSSLATAATTLNFVGAGVTASGTGATKTITISGGGGGGGATDKISEGDTEAEVVDTGTDGHFKVTTEGDERLRIDEEGRVLIGNGGSTVYANANADDLVVGNTTTGQRSGITIVADGNQDARLAFSKGTSYFDALAGYIIYELWQNKLAFYVNMAERLAIDSNGKLLLGFNGGNSQVSSAAIQVQGGDSTNHIAILNSAASDSDGARGGVLSFHGKNSGNTRKTLAWIESSHDGSANDEKGRLVFKTNDGSDGDAPTERLRIDSSGAFGLSGANYGTSGQVLTSSGSGSAPTWTTVSGGGGGGTSDKIEEGNTKAEVVDTGSDGHFKVETEGTERLRIDNSGRVGINTTTYSDTATALVIKNGVSGSDHTLLDIVCDTNETAQVRFSEDGSSFPGQIVYDTNGQELYFKVDSSERLRITSSGNIGIGSSSPVHSLEIENASSTGGRISAHGYKCRNNWGGASGMGNGMMSPANNTLAFTTNSTERMRIKDDGNIDISVTGNYQQGIQLYHDNGGNSVSIICGTGNTATAYAVYDGAGSTYTAKILHNGTIQATNLTDGTTTKTMTQIMNAASGAATNDLTDVLTNNNATSLGMSLGGNLLIGTTTSTSLGDRLLQVGDTSRSATYLELRTSNTGTGGIVFSDGTSGDHGYRGTIEYSHSIDSIFFKTAATERMRIDGTGYVGIGTTSPGCLLEVYRSGSGECIKFGKQTIYGELKADGQRVGFVGTRSSDSKQSGFYIENPGNTGTSNFEALTFKTLDDERMRIDSSGRVLIGTNASGWGNAAHNLTIADTGNCGMTIRAGTSSDVCSIYFADGTTAGANYAGFIDYQHNGDHMRFGTYGGQERMRLDNSGNLGIGTTSPSKKLDVNGDASINGLTIGRGAGDISTNTATGYNSLYSNTTGGYNVGVGYEAVYSNTTGNNNVGIGRKSIYTNTTGTSNTAIGHLTLVSNTTADYNTATGVGALYYNTTGGQNSAYGYDTMLNNTTGTLNVAMGAKALGSNTTGSLNSALGYQALYNNTTASQNTAVGYQALYNNTTAPNNTSVGYAALSSNTVGERNTAVGRNSMLNSISGYDNVAIGNTALNSNTTGYYNSAIGSGAVYTNTTGYGNTASGVNALTANTTGYYNVAEGAFSLDANTTGVHNTALGVHALGSNTTASFNTAIGYGSSFTNTTGASNTSCGAYALYFNTTGNKNTAIGENAAHKNTTGVYNTAVGQGALYNNTTASDNTAVGYQALYTNSTGVYNTAVGMHCLISNTTANNNTGLGWKGLYSNTTGSENVGLGQSALYNNTTGYSNSAIGYQSMYYNTTGYLNVAVGRGSLLSNSTGNNNTAIGYYALSTNTTASENTAVGYQSLYNNTTGEQNVATGNNALATNTVGSNMVAYGVHALYSNTTGGANTAIGRDALYYNTTGGNNTGLGREALRDVTTGNGNIGIGFRDASGTYSPVFGPTTHDNRIVLGNTSITNAYVKVSWTVTSDERDKMNFAPVPHGLDFVNQLKPTAYQFKVNRDTEEPSGDVRYGFKAQEVLALEGDNPVIIDIEDPDHLKYKGEHLVPVLVNAVQELTEIVEQLQNEIQTLKG